MKKFIQKLFGDTQTKTLKEAQKKLPLIHAALDRYEAEGLSPAENTATLMQRFQEGETLDSLLPEAFANVAYACSKCVGETWLVREQNFTWSIQKPYDVQFLGAYALHHGKIAEMRTGEGKTLVSSMPAYLNALSGNTVYVVTVNDYLAKRDSEWMGGLYEKLGLQVGVVVPNQSLDEKKSAYACHIVYGTNNEFGFDYLRDNMAISTANQVQKKLFFALIDEVDSVLIDESRTPLIISAPGDEDVQKYALYQQLVSQLEENVHYNVDEKQKVCTLSEAGIAKMEELLGLENIYTEKGYEEVHHIEQALKAKAIYKKDVDYMVQNAQIIIVDEFTGRLMEGRRFGQGLHQAIEAKEGVPIQRESKTLASITFQNYFRMFEKLAGMTGTAKTEEEEFSSIYGLEVVSIPTHLPIARQDSSDAIYKNRASKISAITKKVQELHAKGQPVLVGTISVEKSEELSKAFQKAGIPHHVLNAKHHEKEAEIIALAGQKGAVTIATNMAGRGTDIKLGEGVQELGGLYVLGSERHESRRIDNQLRGRSGRQGDPGFSQFYVGMDDDLMRIFGGERMMNLMDKLGIQEDMPIENSLISRSIENAQAKVEGHHFDIRKHLVQYDDVMNRHRVIVYQVRQSYLEKASIHSDVLEKIDALAQDLVLTHLENPGEIHEIIKNLHREAAQEFTLEAHDPQHPEASIQQVKAYLQAEYQQKKQSLPDPAMLDHAEKMLALRATDHFWMEHLNELRELRNAVSLSGYAQKDPLVEYQNLAFDSFQKMLQDIDRALVRSVFQVKIKLG